MRDTVAIMLLQLLNVYHQGRQGQVLVRFAGHVGPVHQASLRDLEEQQDFLKIVKAFRVNLRPY